MINLRSEREIRLMRKAGLVVWRAHQDAAELVRPGVTPSEIDAAIERVYKECGAESLFQGVPGDIPYPSVSCLSVNDAIVHGIPNDKPLQEGDIIGVDTGCTVNGWCADAAVTHPVGSVSAATQKLLDTTRRTLDLAIRLMGTKRRWSEVAVELDSLVRDAGFVTVEQFVGHGIGRELHEDPQVPHFVGDEQQSADFTLRPGLVIAVEPMVNVGVKEAKIADDKWTQVTADGKNSAHFEHTIALTASGPRLLTGPPGEDDGLGAIPNGNE